MKHALLVFAAMTLALAGFRAWQWYHSEPDEPSLYEVAPEFELQSPDGPVLTSSELAGHVVVLDFWASWCGPCLISFPHMQEVVDHYEDNPEVLFLAVNTGDDSLEAIKDFELNNSYTFLYVRDVATTLTLQYAAFGIPTLAVLDREGRLQYHRVGYIPDDYEGTLIREIDRILEE